MPPFCVASFFFLLINKITIVLRFFSLFFRSLVGFQMKVFRVAQFPGDLFLLSTKLLHMSVVRFEFLAFYFVFVSLAQLHLVEWRLRDKFWKTSCV